MLIAFLFSHIVVTYNDESLAFSLAPLFTGDASILSQRVYRSFGLSDVVDEEGARAKKCAVACAREGGFACTGAAYDEELAKCHLMAQNADVAPPLATLSGPMEVFDRERKVND